MKKTLILALALSMSFVALAQEKITEGILVSKQTISTPSDNVQTKMQIASLGEMQTTIYIKGVKSRSELSNPQSGDVTTISDMDKKEVLMIMDSPTIGKGYMLQKIELTEEVLNSINLVEGTETKTILGYECKQYTVKINQGGQEIEMELFTTDKIAAEASQQATMLGDKLKGFPLYSVTKMNQLGTDMIITTEITEIKKGEVADEKFSLTPPEGYRKMN
ncbi:DUF4412 domain-containing protein [Winogradskyella immobilis]|uniref:DUF4412 domain-containing protein n=1 Tax=Winogradskyella immobilis TaxID=2816852 RepID=A0ABS8ER46_9FLAO|nr:DUF4412 domain-containing protein [Winogradskyella immobilis]MCC1485481.1 DUF4412 domain-containing protein [Winogradskyella immobilis]MCG0017573.1 DUF4412 domain-containing protein [Winogradskyella immobilis]